MNEQDVILKIVVESVALGDDAVDRIYKRAVKAAKYLAAQGLLDPMPGQLPAQQQQYQHPDDGTMTK